MTVSDMIEVVRDYKISREKVVVEPGWSLTRDSGIDTETLGSLSRGFRSQDLISKELLCPIVNLNRLCTIVCLLLIWVFVATHQGEYLGITERMHRHSARSYLAALPRRAGSLDTVHSRRD